MTFLLFHPYLLGFLLGAARHIRWPKYWSFNFSISASNEYSGLISFGIDWFHILAVQGTLKSLLQHYNLKASILWCSFMVQLSHLYMTTGKKPKLWLYGPFLAKWYCLFFNVLSRFVIVWYRNNYKSDMAVAMTEVWKRCHGAPE